MSDSKQIERITGYENIMNEARDIMNGNDFYRERQERLSSIISELRDYYESPVWREDFEDDEKGLLPETLHRGVLSEDGLYDLLNDYSQFLEESKDRIFEYHSMYDQDHFSLHDCRVTSIVLDGTEMTFLLPEGIFSDRYGDDWPNTSSAAVQWTLNERDETYLHVFVRENGKTVRYEYDLGEIIDNINSGKWEMEIGYRYKGNYATIYRGWIWTLDEPWHYEAELTVATRYVENVLWNKPEEEKK